MMNGHLTELEQTKLENFALKHTNLQQAIQVNLNARATFIRQIEAAHPHHQFNEQTGGLVYVPEEGEPEPANLT